MAQFESFEVVYAVVPTVVFPFALLTAILSSLVAWIAALFGMKTKELEIKAVLGWFLKPKILVTALVLNVAAIVGVKGWTYVTNSSHPLWLVQWKNRTPVSVADARYEDTALKTRLPGPGSSEQDETEARLEWQSKLPAGSFRGATISGPSLFFGAMDGRVYEASRQDGRIVRSFYIGKEVTPAPLIWRGRLFAGEGDHLTHHARIYVFDLANGKLLGTVPTHGHTEGDLVIGLDSMGRESLFVAAGADGIYAVDPETLQIRWTRKVGHFDAGVAVADGVVFVPTGIEKGVLGAARPTLSALDAATGRVHWTVELGAPGWSRPVFAGEDVCVALGEIYDKSDYGQVACYRRSDGRPTLAANAREPLFSPPLVGSDRLIVLGLKGTICAIAMKDASTLWCREFDAKKRVYAALSFDDEGDVIAPIDGEIVRVAAKDGRILERWKGADGEWSRVYGQVAVAAEGWYAVDGDGVLIRLASSRGRGLRPGHGRVAPQAN